MRAQGKRTNGIRVWAVAGIAAIACAIAPASAAATTQAFFESTAGLMTQAREYPAAAMLPNGQVLLAGGYDSGGGRFVDTAELFDPVTSTFSPIAATMTDSRRAPGTAVLADGRVLIVGGVNDEGEFLASAEIFDPAAESFSATGSMAMPRRGAATVALPDGRVLVAGGSKENATTLGSAEIYDPATGEFSPTAAPIVGREFAGAAALPDGRVLLAGGRGPTGLTKSAEIFDPETEAFAPTGSLAWYSHGKAAPLADGTVVFFGLELMQIFDPATETFTNLSVGPELEEAFGPTPVQPLPRTGGTAVPLPGGRVLLAGGLATKGAWGGKRVWIYVSAPSPVSGEIDFHEVPVGGTSETRLLTVTNKGAQVLEIGSASLTGADAASFKIVADGCSGATLDSGEECEMQLTARAASARPFSAAVELTDNAPSSPQSFPLRALGTAYAEPAALTGTGHTQGTATALPGGQVLIAGGSRYREPSELSFEAMGRTAEIFDPTTGEFTTLASELTTGRSDAAASRLGDGTVLIAGGRGGPSVFDATDSAEIYDPSSREFTAADSLGVLRVGPFAAPLPDGTALVGGGGCVDCSEEEGEWHNWDTTEIYDPATGEFRSGPSMLTARRGAVAAPLPDGRVIVIGGRNDEGELAGTEIYDPATGAFEVGPSFPGVHSVITATAMPNGRVLVVALSIWEYDPVSETFVNSHAEGRQFGAAAAPLPDGRALLAGYAAGYGAQRSTWIYVREPLASGSGIDFGEVPAGDSATPQTLTISNQLRPALEIQSASLTGPDAAAFGIVSDGCSSKTLWQGESCALEISATVTRVGPLSAAVGLEANAWASQGFPLSIEGIAPASSGPARTERSLSSDSGSPSPGGGPVRSGAAATAGPKAKQPKRICRRQSRGKRANAKASKVRCVRQAKGQRQSSAAQR